MRNILIVDNDPFTLHIFSGLLKNQSHFIQVFPAGDIPSALEVLARKTIHILITGMHIPETDAFKLALLVSDDPGICTILVTDNASDGLCSKIKAMPSVIHFDQILDLSMLTKRIFTELQIDYGGQFRGLSLSFLLQVVELEGRSCTLLITAKSKSGILYLVNGKLVAASVGKLTGKPAALEILNWQNVRIDIDYKPRELETEIDTPLMTLLLESGRVMDETLNQRHNLRRHTRYDCLVGVEYRIDEACYQCYMRDLSEGGAYIETEQTVGMGQEMVLTLYSPMLERSCEIGGKVVRKDAGGVGVHFQSIIPEQKQVINSLIESCCSPIASPTGHA